MGTVWIRSPYWAVPRKRNNLIKSYGKPWCDRFLGKCGSGILRSLDFEVVSLLFRLASAPASFAKLHESAGHELLGEGFAKGQTGSFGYASK